MGIHRIISSLQDADVDLINCQIGLVTEADVARPVDHKPSFHMPFTAGLLRLQNVPSLQMTMACAIDLRNDHGLGHAYGRVTPERALSTSLPAWHQVLDTIRP